MAKRRASAGLRDGDSLIAAPAILAPIKQHIDALAAEQGYPAAAVDACLARPAEAAPLLRAILQRAARGLPLSDAERGQLFVGLHILAKLRDEQSFLPLMRLLRRPSDELDDLLGDVLTETLQKIAASVFDGDADSLFEAIDDPSLDDSSHHALWGAATTLTFQGRIGREPLRAAILRFAPPIDDELSWAGWADAITHLGYEDIEAEQGAAWIDQRLPDAIMTRKHFDGDLAAALHAPDDASRLAKSGMGTLDDVAGALSWVDWDGPPAPVVNPMRHVGRNDPCPCGSGKKAKKCCLASA